jgi:hypothetical protein
MESGEEIKIDIIGAGQVVQNFLEEKMSGVDIRVYDRKSQDTSTQFVRPLHTFEPSDRFLVLCASSDEESILKTSNSQARMAIAKENLAIAKDLMQKGFFKKQFVFVLTNPSEIIAEFLFRKSENKCIYALGLNTDHKRYSEILKQPEFLHLDSNFSISGNHYDFPYPIFNPPLSKHDEDTAIKSLGTSLQTKIRSEFNGYRPPVKSGVTAIKDLVQSLITRQNLFLSGYCSEFDCFSGGVIDFCSLTFSPSLGNSSFSKARIESIAKSHHDSYSSITSSKALKESV